MAAPQPGIRWLSRVNRLCADSSEKPDNPLLPLVVSNEPNQGFPSMPTLADEPGHGVKCGPGGIRHAGPSQPAGGVPW